jgi:hypothetical protein
MSPGSRLLRQGTASTGALDLIDLYREIDIRVALPTLALRRRDDRVVMIARTATSPTASAASTSSPEHLALIGDQDATLDEIEDFLARE